MATLDWYPALRLPRYRARLAQGCDGAQPPLFPPPGESQQEAEA